MAGSGAEKCVGGNLLDHLPKGALSEEQEDVLAAGDGIRVVRIISTGQTSEDWYDQDDTEWVMVVQGEGKLLIEGEGEREMKRGDWVLLPAHVRHKVTFTSPLCVWLAFHVPESAKVMQ